MAKVKLGNVKGSKGDKGDRGSLWRVSDKMTGQSTSDTAFPGAEIDESVVGDMCLNPLTCDIYKCTAGGDAATAKWVWVMNNRGPQGPQGPKGDPTTVDAALSATSTNPVQNKVVATKFQDVQDSLSQKIRTERLADAVVYQNVTDYDGDEPILFNVTLPDGRRYIFSVHIGKKIELYDAVSQRAVWVADLTSICS